MTPRNGEPLIAAIQDFITGNYLDMRKPTFGVSVRSDTKWAVQSQKMARGLKFQILEVERLYYLCSENKGTDQLCDTAQLICAFGFAYA